MVHYINITETMFDSMTNHPSATFAGESEGGYTYTISENENTRVLAFRDDNGYQLVIEQY